MLTASHPFQVEDTSQQDGLQEMRLPGYSCLFSFSRLHYVT